MTTSVAGDIVAEIKELKKSNRRHHPRPLLPGGRDSGTRRLSPATASTRPGRHQGRTTPTIVFCGVHFMAETAKILNPAKARAAARPRGRLLPGRQLPRRQARPLPGDAPRSTADKFQTVTYINSTAAVKALSDWVVTSGNAEQIIRRVPADHEILFVPDQHLGHYLQEVTGRKMILWDGSCMVHEIFSVGDLLTMKEAARRPRRSPIRNARPTSASTATSSAAPRR